MYLAYPTFGLRVNVHFLFPEVTLKVHISDASTHQPIADALIEIFANQVSVASGTSSTDGVAFIKFQYKLGNQLIVTATRHAYVPNSAPWKPIRLPGEFFYFSKRSDSAFGGSLVVGIRQGNQQACSVSHLFGCHHVEECGGEYVKRAGACAHTEVTDSCFLPVCPVLCHMPDGKQ